MDDLQFGSRNKRGDWAPAQKLEAAPFAALPSPARLGRWLMGYFWPWNLFFFTVTVVWWTGFLPDMATMAALSPGWIVGLLTANIIGILGFFGAFELRYYVKRVQGRRFKYNGKFPAEHASDVFWFKRQDIDNFLRCLLIGIPIGTAVEVLLLWLMASGRVATLSWAEHPFAITAAVLAVPLIQELHFYVIHRAMHHWAPLYRWVHSLHHNSVNPSPWSSLSMHPMELLPYFGVASWALLLPSHPIVVVMFFTVAGFGAIVGHIGFDRLETGSDRATPSHAYAHYLHHKYFDVNYCDNGTLPLDVWFGSWHDGTAEGERLMQEQFQKKRERMNTA